MRICPPLPNRPTLLTSGFLRQRGVAAQTRKSFKCSCSNNQQLVEEAESIPLVEADSLILVDGVEFLVPHKYHGLPLNEVRRRVRISKSNKGNSPWNRGREWSPGVIKCCTVQQGVLMYNCKVGLRLVWHEG